MLQSLKTTKSFCYNMEVPKQKAYVLFLLTIPIETDLNLWKAFPLGKFRSKIYYEQRG